jgi:hypothetical protein
MDSPKPVKYIIEPDTDKKMIRLVGYTLGTAVVGVALFFTGRYIYRKTVSNKEQNLSLDDNSESNLAKRLKMAFDNDGWWGTDVENVRKVFTDLKSKAEFVEVIKSYKKLYFKNLIEDLTDELTSSEYYEMQNILASKPAKTGQAQVFDLEKAKKFAKRFKAAFDYTILGMSATDLGALKQVLIEIPTKQIFELIKLAYKSLYGSFLESDMDSELDIFDFSWKDIIQQKPLK